MVMKKVMIEVFKCIGAGAVIALTVLGYLVTLEYFGI
jgi:hypothetical protein